MLEAAFWERPEIEVAYGDPKKPTLLRITPLRIRQIPAFQRYFRAVFETIAEHEKSAETAFELNIEKMIELDRENLMLAAAIAAEKPVEFIKGGDLADFIKLVLAVFQANKDFIFAKGEPPVSGKKATANDWDWPDAIQHLVSAGHRLADVMGYTMAELLGYSAAIAKQQRVHYAHELMNVRVAQYPEDEFKRYLKDLLDG